MRIIGVDIGGTSIKSAIMDENGKILQRFSFRVDYSKKQDDIIAHLASEILKNLALMKIDASKVYGIGIGCPGSVNSETGYCDYSNNLHWENLPICDIVTQATKIPSHIANDANAACLGEALFGAGKVYKSLVLLTLGTGVGGGLFLDGRLYEGNGGKGAELGHSLLIKDGRPCTCGRRGCLEAYCSVTALVKDTIKAMQKDRSSAMWDYVKGNVRKVNGLTAFECAKAGDASAQKVVDQYIGFLGEGLLNFINIFRPEAIVLGGGLSGQREALTNPLKAYLEKNGYGFGGVHSPKVEVLVSSLGNDAGIYGAAALTLRN